MSSSDSECSIVEPVVKKAKFTGAFKYNTKFSEAWKRTWPFISSVARDPHLLLVIHTVLNVTCVTRL